MKLWVYAFTVIFLLQSVAGAVPIFVEKAPTIGKDIFIPESYGIIESSSFDDYLSPRLVVLLKDAHCNYDAQHNIARILEVLVRDYKFDLVAVEGAVGLLDFARFWKLENEPAREKMADTFVKKGILSGPEYLTITKDGKLSFSIYGIEDERLYVENFTTFRQTIDHIEETELFMKEITRIIKNLKQKIYPKELLEFDNKSTEYYENTISLTDWVKELNKEAGRLGLVLKEYPNISLTVDSIALEGQIDFKKVELERASAIGSLEKVLSKEELKKMIEESIRFRLGNIASSDYYKYLEELLSSGGLNPNENLPNLIRYIQIVKFQSWIDSGTLFREITSLEDRIKETMFKDNIQRQLNDLSKRVRILNNLFKLTLNRDALEYYMGHKAEFLPANLLSFINIHAPFYNIPMSMLLSNQGFLDTVTSVISSGEKFYYIAVERDVSLVENTLRVMEEKKKSSAIMVIGGFHTDGVINLFETKGIGYVVISPKIVRAEKEGLYLSLMMDKRIQLAQKSSSLAFLKLVAGGEGHLELLSVLGAMGVRREVLDDMERRYSGSLDREVRQVAPGVQILPFSVTVDSGGRVIVARNLDYRGEEIPSTLIECLEEVLQKNPVLASFIAREGIIERYLNTAFIIECKQRIGRFVEKDIQRRLTLGFITFYLGLAMVYEEGGWLSLPEALRGESLPEGIRMQEKRNLPSFKAELVSGLKEKGVVEVVAEAIANYLFTMPAYGVVEKGVFYQTQFFNSYMELVGDILGVKQDVLQVYRYLQTYLADRYEVGHEPLSPDENVAEILRTNNGKRVEVLARYIASNGEEFKEYRDAIENVLGIKFGRGGWRQVNWILDATTSQVRDEDGVQDPPKRDLYVTALSRTGMTDELVASERYRKKKVEFERRLATPDEVWGRIKNRTFVHDVSMLLGDAREVGPGRYEFSDLGFPIIGLIGEVQVSKENDQYFLYETDAEREACKAYLSRYGIEVEDRQFKKVNEYKDIQKKGRVRITMLSYGVRDKITPDKEDRLVIGNPKGTDLMLMGRLALVIARPDNIEAQMSVVESELKDLFRRYYLGAIGEREIQELLKNISITEGIFRIILPPITPFVKEYYDALIRAREVISKAA